MRRLWRILEVTAFPLLPLGGSLGALVLALSRHTQIAALLAASVLLLAGAIQLRLSQARSERSSLHELRKEIRNERAGGTICITVGVVIALMALFLSPIVVIAVGFACSLLACLAILAVIGDSRIREKHLDIGSISPAQECFCIQRWASRLATMPDRFSQFLAKVATATPLAGQVTRLRALPVALAATAMLFFGVTGGALAAKGLVQEFGGDRPSADAEEDEQPASPPLGGSSLLPGPAEEMTYEQSCPDLPDPLEIGHGLGELFRYDGAFKAGCGTRARQVLQTDAWFAAGVCAGRQRSVAVVGQSGEAVLLYGAGAKFAWQAGIRSELVGAEVQHPDGGDVYAVETLAGTYGFARTAPVGSGSGEARDCSDVTDMARPFAELPPPMLRLWRDLLERRAAWSWPIREDQYGDALAFVAYPSGAQTARGTCTDDMSCSLEVDGVRLLAAEAPHVSLDELAAYMPPPAP
jgi:hypothetical protein